MYYLTALLTKGFCLFFHRISHELNIFLKTNVKAFWWVNFNIMSSWAIYKKQSLEKRYCLFYFILGFCVLCKCWKVFSKVFTRYILGIVRDHVKFTFNFFRWEICHKSHVHGPHHPHWNIFHQRIMILNHIFVCWIWLHFDF